MRENFSEFIDARDCRIHLRCWGDPDAPLLFMFHGWGDMSASWQFVVDELRREWRVIAPDWRGCGKSDYLGRTYYFPDYLADIETILDHYSPRTPTRVIAHSLGANAICLYAGVRPERISHFVNLEGIGGLDARSEEAPRQYENWLDGLKAAQGYRVYPDRAALAARLRRDNPRLSAPRAAFLAEHFGIDNADGGIGIALDPAHRLPSPTLYHIEGYFACWRRVTASMLLVTAVESHLFKRFFAYDSDDYRQRVAAFSRVREARLADCGHNMHHDRPEEIARLIEDFLP